MTDDEIIVKLGEIYTRRAEGNTDTTELYRAITNPNLQLYGAPILHFAASKADPNGIRELLLKGADPAGEDSLGANALHALAYDSNSSAGSREDIRESAVLLADAGVSTLKRNSDDRTCVFTAAEKGASEIIAVLAERKKKLDITGPEGGTPLHGACEYAKLVARSFFNYALPDYEKAMADPASSESTLKFRAEQYDGEKASVDRYFEVVRILVEAGVDPDRKDRYGKSAKELAFDCKDSRIAAVLNGTYDSNATEGLNTKGMNLAQAVGRSDYEALAAIIEAGADPNAAHGVEESAGGISLGGKLPLAIACELLDNKAAKMLLDAGADPNLKDSQGNTPLAYATSVNAAVRANDSVFKNSVVESLVKDQTEKGLSLDAPVDNEGNTLLTKAAKMIDTARGYGGSTLPGRLLTALLRSGADSNSADHNRVTSLMAACAVRGRYGEDAQLALLEKGANVSAADDKGRTPLMYAASNYDRITGRNMAEMLFEFGDPDVLAVGNDRKGALDIATEKNNEEFVKYILTKI
ncbi:MAG: ankyrin repeat domain-containing protein [Candidatus Methanoplasma sp.]|jgi:ankyrin repeat protein|nr:ankyrin repeat domain-containing protein [Candidatus Methanoplasma sp.]